MGVTIKELDVGALARGRLGEAVAELGVAEAFLGQGLLRNAAGKAFQAWKAFISYIALRNVELLREKYRGNKRVGSALVPMHEWVAAVAPTSRLMELSIELEKVIPGITELTAIALELHEYQYNGPDPEGIRSKVPNDEVATALIRKLIERARELMKEASK